MSNTKIISKSPCTMDVEYYEYDSPLDRLLEYHLSSDDYDSKAVETFQNEIKTTFQYEIKTTFQNEIKTYSQDEFEARLKDRWKEFNLKEFAKKIGPILDKAVEENQRCNKQVQEAIAKLKETTIGKLYLEEIAKK